MHLPEAKRRAIVYATTAILATGTLLVAFAQLDKPLPQPASATASVEASPVPVPEVESTRVLNKARDIQAPVAEASKPEPEVAAKREKVETYVVQEGDIIGIIADKFGLKSSTILSANDLSEDSVLQIGQELQIPQVDGLVHTVRTGDNLWDLAANYDVSLDEIIAANADVDPSNFTIQPGQTLLLPGATRQLRSNMVASRSSGSRPSGRSLVWPAVAATTDDFGWRTHPVYGGTAFHDGVDLNVGSGTPLGAAASGTVILASRHGGYGLTVKIDHGGGLVTLYAHMSQIDVSVGESVAAGDHIGYSGNTGVTTGPHLHFSLYQNGSPIDPMPWLP